MGSKKDGVEKHLMLYNRKRKKVKQETTLREAIRDLLIRIHELEKELNTTYKKLNLGEED